MEKILIKNGRVWDGEQFLFADILTEGDRIAKIEKDIRDSALFTYDADGKTVSCGLCDIHAHFKGISDDTYGIQTEMSCLPFGVTSACDAGALSGDKALLDSFAVKNTAFISVGIEKNHADLLSVDARLGRFGDAAIGLKVCFDKTLTEVYDLTPLKEVCKYASAKGLKVMVHCSNSPTPMSDIIRTMSSGDILTHVFHGGENSCCENDFEALRLAKEKGVILDAGFAGYVHTDFSNFENAVRSGFLPDVISTDITSFSAYKRGGRYGMSMCMSLARHFGMEEDDIFRAVTSSAAKALGRKSEWGALKVGRCADIAVFYWTDEGFCMTDKAGNLAESNKGYRCVLTVCDGQVVYKY